MAKHETQADAVAAAVEQIRAVSSAHVVQAPRLLFNIAEVSSFRLPSWDSFVARHLPSGASHGPFLALYKCDLDDADQAEEDTRELPDEVDEDTITRLAEEADAGIPRRKLRSRGRPAIAGVPSKVYSVRLPETLVAIADARAEVEGVTRAEVIRKAIIDYVAAPPE